MSIRSRNRIRIRLRIRIPIRQRIQTHSHREYEKGREAEGRERRKNAKETRLNTLQQIGLKKKRNAKENGRRAILMATSDSCASVSVCVCVSVLCVRSCDAFGASQFY